MHKELGSCGDNAVATLQANAANKLKVWCIEGHYHVECRDAQGNLNGLKSFLT